MFVDGDANMLPWFERAHKFLILIRMCKKTRKLLFASSFAMQIFVFLCATNLYITRVVNGGGKGTPKAEFAAFDRKKLKELAFGDAFLDSTTGDVYGFDSQKDEFYPIANVGIHNHKAAQEHGKVQLEPSRVAMLKSYRYHAHATDTQEEIFVSKSSESTLKIVKAFSTHWINEGVGFGDHLVLCGNAWDVHPINTIDPENYYRVTAESDRGPMVITLNNAICTQFHINPKYPLSLTILRNYVLRMMGHIHSTSDRLDIPMAMALQLPGTKPAVKASGGQGLADIAGKHYVGHSEVKHSGYAFSKRGGPLVVGNNATTYGTVKTAKGNVGSDTDEDSMSSSVYSLGPRTKSYTSKSTIQKLRFARQKTQREPKEPLRADFQGGFNSKTVWGAQEVREFLHPGYPTETMPRVMSLMDTIVRSPTYQLPHKNGTKVVFPV